MSKSKVCEITSKIKTKWLEIGDYGLNLQKMSCVVFFVTPDILFYITDLAIMQDFRDNEKKTITNDRQSLISDFISNTFVLTLCETLHLAF